MWKKLGDLADQWFVWEPWLEARVAEMSAWITTVPRVISVLVALATCIAAVVWAWTRSKDYVYEGAPDRQSWRDLRIWAAIMIAIQIVLYLALW